MLAAPFLWEGLTAVATLVLAAGTVYLAWSTRKVARGTQAEVLAQWRPVLLPSPDAADRKSVGYSIDEGRLFVKVRNAGRGPALFIRARLDPGGFSPDNWSLGALAPDDQVLLRFVMPQPTSEQMQLLFDYRDLTGLTHSSVIVLDKAMGDWRFYDVRPFTGGSVTQLGDAVYPQPGLPDASPRSAPSLLDRSRAGLAAFRRPPASWPGSGFERPGASHSPVSLNVAAAVPLA
jgi:hypothetical protein